MQSLIVIIVFLGLIFSNEVDLENKAPTFYSNTLDGKKFYLSDHLGKDRSIFLNFFATWCLPCRVEMPILDSLQHVYTNTDFYLVNVSGLQQGDLIINVDGSSILGMSELAARIRLSSPGTEISLGVFRNGEEISIAVVLGSLGNFQ